MKNRQSWFAWAYAGFVLAVGLVQSVTSLQSYLAQGGKQPWEPFLWEFSSVALVGSLALGVYRWHVAGLGLGRSRQWARHALGTLLFILIHVNGMVAIRFVVYAVMRVDYEPGSAAQIFAYESGKDLVTYALIVLISQGYCLSLEAGRLRAELAEARLLRLAEQVQPHFLFNTLNLISSVMYEDVARADKILNELATLLRQTLAAQQQTLHSLEAELALIAPYLAIMQARFGHRLRVSIEASAEARHCQVPALLLLAPVENAIKHDVALNTGEVEVRVEARMDQTQLYLSVDNSGSPPQADERAGAIGLSNVRQRVAALYGLRGTVRLQAREAGGSRLSITLPVAAA